jgi:hypothetical protein
MLIMFLFALIFIFWIVGSWLTHIFDGFKSKSYKTKTTVFTHFLHSVLLMILMAPIAAKADSLYLGGYTQHFIDFPGSAHTNNREWVANNNLIAYESGGIGVGYFLNSFGEDSYFIEKKMSLFKNGWLDVSGNGGAVWGYRGCAANDDDPKTRLCPNVNIEVAFGQYQLQPVIILQMKSVTFTTKWVF